MRRVADGCRRHNSASLHLVHARENLLSAQTRGGSGSGAGVERGVGACECGIANVV
jgi:hypothetical protein